MHWSRDGICRLFEFRRIGRLRQETHVGEFEPAERFALDVVARPFVEGRGLRHEQTIHRLPFLEYDCVRLAPILNDYDSR